MEDSSWERARAAVLGRSGRPDGIGSLAEKTVHAVLKQYLEPDERYREVPVEHFVADICRPDGIVEIQSAGFYALNRKLAGFLPNYPVTVVYPAVVRKQLIWVNTDTGELSAPRRSPKRNGSYDALRELYSIRSWLQHPSLTIRIMLLEVEEYKLLNGYGEARKIRASRYDRIPLRIEGEIVLNSARDYRQFLPEELPEPFTMAQWQKATRLSAKMAPRALQVLRDLGLVYHSGMEGRRYLFRRTENGGRSI